MQVKADGLARAGWAVQNVATREILSSDIFANKYDATALRDAAAELTPQRGPQRVVLVRVSVTLIDD